MHSHLAIIVNATEKGLQFTSTLGDDTKSIAACKQPEMNKRL
jgi:hypothetical protein